MTLAIAFWAMAGVVVLAALGVVVLRNVFRAALALILCFLMVAGIYVTLSADFLAVVQVLIYVGAISVLIILAIMMTREVPCGNLENILWKPTSLITLLIFGVITYAVLRTPWNISTAAPASPTTNVLAERLLGPNGYIVPVEIAAVLLLAAIIGAIVLAREK